MKNQKLLETIFSYSKENGSFVLDVKRGLLIKPDGILVVAARKGLPQFQEILLPSVLCSPRFLKGYPDDCVPENSWGIPASKNKMHMNLC